ncbi:hypothetical protein AAEY27_06380 [Kosakonia sp. BYX6]|uniref:ATP-binding protein n=1 Tax=Kosakonia calanthes TaxID=3139408 RepID=A0ABZ3B9Y4_9ENTR
MNIFDLEKEKLRQLSDEQLEELIARLAEAELASVGESPAQVFWGGSITAPDDGIDILVNVANADFKTGFIVKPNTVFQAKKHSMKASSIKKEMCPKGILSATLAELAATGGSYVIVSLEDDCSPPMRKSRLQAMREAVKSDPNGHNLHLDFFDPSKLHQWLRQHPAVMLWVRSVLGLSHSGWRPFGAWSNPPLGADDTLILAPGVSVTMPSGIRSGLKEAIPHIRELVRSTRKAIRIAGLSGTGKTRIVQSLFEEEFGAEALDKTVAIYADVGEGPSPSATSMLETLLAESRRAIMVLDNCPSDLHAQLASRLVSQRSQVSLITVEYDIRDDKPQQTDVIHIEAAHAEMAETLLLRRFPKIGQLNAKKIADFADGNARISLAVAERVEVGESLAHLSDNQLFDRLFEQRNQPDENLRAHAESLSLVYSFSDDSSKTEIDELAVLASLCEITRTQLFRSVGTLIARHIAQKRAHWRAILPHAIANRLASGALTNIPIEMLQNTFEAPGSERLLMSFAHRLGYLHEHPVAQNIAEAWLTEGGFLYNLLDLEDRELRILEYIAPVVPNAVLKRIDEVISAAAFCGIKPAYSPCRVTILNLLELIAYDADMFNRCVSLLLRMADFEDESNNFESSHTKILGLFQPYLSGTRASLTQRLSMVKDTLLSSDPKRQSLGLRMLSSALDGPPWHGAVMHDFGARPRDYGYEPNKEELVAWRHQFIDLAVAIGLNSHVELATRARSVFAKKFRSLWRHQAIREKLVEAARTLNRSQTWIEGWSAVRLIIQYDYNDKQADGSVPQPPVDLVALAAELTPTDLMDNIKAFVLGDGHAHWVMDGEFDGDAGERHRLVKERLAAKAEELGEAYACSGNPVSMLGADLFSPKGMPHREAFGKGLAKGSHDPKATWEELVTFLHTLGYSSFNIALLCGFIEQLTLQARPMAEELLDQCLESSQLRAILVGLQPEQYFDNNAFQRCMQALNYEDVSGWLYERMLWRESYSLSQNQIITLAERLLEKDLGASFVLDGLAMKLHNKDPNKDVLGAELRRIGLLAAAQRLQQAGREQDYNIEIVIDAVLSFQGNEQEKVSWLDAIFAYIDTHYGYAHDFERTFQATAAKMPEAFLQRIFSGDEKSQRKRKLFIQNEDQKNLPLADIDVEILIRWCQKQAISDAWQVIASGIPLWVNAGNEGSLTLNPKALHFLEEAPDVGQILQMYAHQIEPMSWSGPRSEVLQTRVKIFETLADHHDKRIAEAAAKTIVTILQRIEAEREEERKRDDENELRFE